MIMAPIRPAASMSRRTPAVSYPGPTRVPSYSLDVKLVLTNRPCVTPVRGAGYPQGCFVMERLLDKAAREIGLTRDEIRRRNLIPASGHALSPAAGQPCRQRHSH